MAFIPITIEAYLRKAAAENPAHDIPLLRKRLEAALHDHNNGYRCGCGTALWVIGSAHAGAKTCFSCFTGKSEPQGDFEIDAALRKNKAAKGRRHIDDIPPYEIGGYFTDDGYEINMDLVKKPGLCLCCIHDDDPNEEIICNLTRSDQEEEKEFVCHHFKKRKG